MDGIVLMAVFNSLAGEVLQWIAALWLVVVLVVGMVCCFLAVWWVDHPACRPPKRAADGGLQAAGKGNHLDLLA